MVMRELIVLPESSNAPHASKSHPPGHGKHAPLASLPNRTHSVSPSFRTCHHSGDTPPCHAQGHPLSNGLLQSPHIHTTMEIPPRLTKSNLGRLHIQYNHVEVTFEEEVRRRCLQKAGRELGFHLTLDHYEKDGWELISWMQTQSAVLRNK
ncbi:hypothetical protein BKA66DRAFT_171684 [Pyrenochaeta sp. MPI-SDFR-AT-0127]|nr:hypothetical protein BKA66DRAFT_171684 [Pyrenochaeta sp. MPI-SDFR-AT-0127]